MWRVYAERLSSDLVSVLKLRLKISISVVCKVKQLFEIGSNFIRSHLVLMKAEAVWTVGADVPKMSEISHKSKISEVLCDFVKTCNGYYFEVFTLFFFDTRTAM
jgi:hypothetical protein